MPSIDRLETVMRLARWGRVVKPPGPARAETAQDQIPRHMRKDPCLCAERLSLDLAVGWPHIGSGDVAAGPFGQPALRAGPLQSGGCR